MTNGLSRIVERKRIDLARHKAELPPRRLEALARRASPAMDFKRALTRSGGVSVIAEMKKASPSAGRLRPLYDPAFLARAYARAGARALSVLTEENFFEGRLDHVTAARAASGLPVLRKDFLFDPYQVLEARAAGAAAVLLIVAILSDWELRALLKAVRSTGMAALVEVHDAAELETAVRAGADLIGVNSRNLKDLTVDTGNFKKLIPKVPAARVVVAESGIKTPEDVRSIGRLGAHAVLVGESLLRQADVESAVRVLVEAGRS